MIGMTTSEGSPRASLLQQAVRQGQTAAHMSPMSFQRGPIHQQSPNAPVMTFLPKGGTSTGHQQNLAQMFAQIARARMAQQGGKSNALGNTPIWHPPTSDGVSGGLGPLRPPSGGNALPLLLQLALALKGGA